MLGVVGGVRSNAAPIPIALLFGDLQLWPQQSLAIVDQTQTNKRCASLIRVNSVCTFMFELSSSVTLPVFRFVRVHHHTTYGWPQFGQPLLNPAAIAFLSPMQ